MAIRAWALVCTATLALAAASALAGDPGPDDFKIAFALYQVAEEPVDRGDLVFHRGRVYRFRHDSPELIIIKTTAREAEFLDIRGRDQASISFARIDLAMAALREALGQTIAELEKKGGRANLLAAAATRELLDPPLEVSFDDAKHTLHLQSQRVQVDAVGEPESDPARLAMIGEALVTLVKIDAMRAPDHRNPPFVQLTTLTDLTMKRQLRPSEITTLYRLGGPPLKYRWTYHLVPQLTDREREALARVEYLRLHASRLSFDQYERRGPR